MQQKDEQQQSSTINLFELISICIRVAYESAHIIKEISEEKDQGIQWKEQNDPVTKADIKA